MQKENLSEISKILSSDRNDYMKSFRKNLDIYLDQPGITLKTLSEEAGIPFSTLNSLVYGDSKDCKLSTAVALARALNVSIDELVGAETIDNEIRRNIAACRNLPQNSLYLIKWYIKHQELLNLSLPKNKRVLNLMEPYCNGSGNLKLQEVYKTIDITNVNPEIRAKVFIGIRVPCDHYMPLYTPYDILLVANDRPANLNEHMIVVIDNNIFLAQRKLENSVPKLFGLRDGRYRADEKDVDEIIGYVAEVIRD